MNISFVVDGVVRSDCVLLNKSNFGRSLVERSFEFESSHFICPGTLDCSSWGWVGSEVCEIDWVLGAVLLVITFPHS